MVPASKSHTIRRLFIATLANGVSELIHPLDSLDTRSCVSVCQALGAEITEQNHSWMVQQRNGRYGITAGPRSSHNSETNDFVDQRSKICNVGNSGTTLFFGLAAAALRAEPTEFDGDVQIRRRTAGPLLEALIGLGASVKSAPSGCAPVTIRGPWKGGRVSLSCLTSQYLSALLLAAPMAPAGVVTEIDVPLLNERPYVEMTLSYLDSQSIAYETEPAFSYFRIPGGSTWKPVSGPVPADFSSAAFPAAAAVISEGNVTLLGLDPDDIQGDKIFFSFLEKMGCLVQWKQTLYEWQLKISRQGPLRGGEFDLGNTPDLLPAMAAIACFAQGDTALINVASARIKETDRIAVMGKELRKLGIKTSERHDALIIHGLGLNQAKNRIEGSLKVDGHLDHRITMALACAALGCSSPVEIAGAESAEVSYSGFWEMLEAGLL